MSRKLRFFMDQIKKAGVQSTALPVVEPDIELEELEVYLHFICRPLLRFDFAIWG